MFAVQLVLLALVVVALGSIVWSTLRHGISPMPTSRAVLREVLAALPEQVEGELHELGAGWGTLAFPVAARFPGAKVIAWEASLFPYLFCRLRALVQPRPNLELRFCDFTVADLRRAGLVLTYLWTGGMAKLGPKFDAELPHGALVVSHTFAWRGHEPEATRTASDLFRTQVFRYRVTRS